MSKPSKESEQAIINRRAASDRRGSDRRKASTPVAQERRGSGERRAKVARRRQIDPTTCERDYSGEEIEFMHALDAYKRSSGRMFPTCSEILEVLRGLGYIKSTVITSLGEPAAVGAESLPPATGTADENTEFELNYGGDTLA